ncbi:MAG TPA: D-arabinose 5-phosphate isomerase [Gammaproteobacteria bacterium]|nr:D-arabinose 5-phosphate isomerase [Gammaproteobacteria bacterium]
MNVKTEQNFLEFGRTVLEIETQAIAQVLARLDDTFNQACELMLRCPGRVVVIGMGKSGHIGSKIAATLASTGTPAFFVHPGEASHGDLGMITTQDVVLGLSNSGETEEILILLPIIKRLGVPLITLTGNPHSKLATMATVNIDVSVSQEACPLGLAPTASTTAALAMGDAIAVTLLKARGFTEEDFARSHPGGRLGKRLLIHVDDIMHTDQDVPMVSPDTPVNQSLLEMTNKRLGMTAIVDQQQRLLGVFTDGDLRRILDKRVDLHHTPISECMTTHPITVNAGILAAEALEVMERHKINQLLITDNQQRLIGALNMHDMLRAGVV